MWRTKPCCTRRSSEFGPRSATRVVLFGTRPSGPGGDQGYGWIVHPADFTKGPWTVSYFVEKPDAAIAGELRRRGALWNTFIMRGSARSFFALFCQHLPRLVTAFCRHLRGKTLDRVALEQLYRTLPRSDFSRDVLEKATGRIRVADVPPCGWSDLGTPARLLTAQARFLSQRSARPKPTAPAASEPTLSP